MPSAVKVLVYYPKQRNLLFFVVLVFRFLFNPFHQIRHLCSHAKCGEGACLLSKTAKFIIFRRFGFSFFVQPVSSNPSLM
jgi:hypothetical protein